MQLLEWLVILLVYFAAYSLWSALETRRERAPIRPKKTRARRTVGRTVKLGVIALCLLGLGVAYNSSAAQRLLGRLQAPSTPGEQSETQDEMQHVLQGEVQRAAEAVPPQLIIAPPLLLGAAQGGLERPSALSRVGIAALPSASQESPDEVDVTANTLTQRAPSTPAPPAATPTRVPVSPPTPAVSDATQPEIRTPTRPKPTATPPQPPARTVEVAFQSDPAGATLYVDGRRVGVTPLEVTLEAGRSLPYTLKAERNLPNHQLYYPHLGVLETVRDTALDVWLERLNSEEVAALRTRGGRRDLPAFDSFASD